MKIKYIFLILVLSFISIGNISAKTIRECTYNANPDSYDGHKFVLKIDDKYNYTLHHYTYNHSSFKYNTGVEQKVLNWDDSLKDEIKNKGKCPTYLADAKNFLGDSKIYFYFDKKKAEEKAKEGFLWLGYTIKITKDEDKNSGNDNNLEDKEEGTSNVENNKDEDIKEFKKTYALGNFSDSSNGKSVILYTKYNFTTNTSLSTQISIPNYDGAVGFIYNGDINSFTQNVITPIVKENKWPQNMYCGEISASLMVANSAKVIIGTANKGDMVCSNDKTAFIDSTNDLSGFEDNNSSNNPGDYDDIIDIDGNGNSEQYDDVCALIEGETLKQIQNIVGYVQMGTVFLILVLGMLDFTGAIGSSEENAFKKAGSKFLKRLIAGALVFLIPAILGIILNLVSVSSGCAASIFK